MHIKWLQEFAPSCQLPNVFIIIWGCMLPCCLRHDGLLVASVKHTAVTAYGGFACACLMFLLDACQGTIYLAVLLHPGSLLWFPYPPQHPPVKPLPSTHHLKPPTVGLCYTHSHRQWSGHSFLPHHYAAFPFPSALASS